MRGLASGDRSPDHALCDVLLGWDRLERRRNRRPVVDFNVSGLAGGRHYRDRHEVLDDLLALQERIGESFTTLRMRAHEAYLRALMGQQLPFQDYVEATQGVVPSPYSEEEIARRREDLERALAAVGVEFGPRLLGVLARRDESVPRERITRTFRSVFRDARGFAERITGVPLNFALKIAVKQTEEYWDYWVDGTSQRFALTFNGLPRRKPLSECVQFVYHELLGHCGQICALRQLIAKGALPRSYGITTVHTPEQFLFEGIAQSWPLWAVEPHHDTLLLRARVLLARYRGVVHHNAHIMLNEGIPVERCAEYVVSHLPFVGLPTAFGSLPSRSTDELFRSYQFIYGVSLDRFAEWALGTESADRRHEVLRWCYTGLCGPDDVVRTVESFVANS